MNRDNLNKKIEESKKIFEKMFSCPVSYHEEGGQDGKNGHFTIKLGNSDEKEKNIEILDDFEKALGNGQPVSFEIQDSDGELKKVSKEEFANWITEGKEEKNIKTPPKESLIYGASGDIDGTTVFRERKGQDGFIRESYYQPRSEEEKKQIIERNRERREKEKSQVVEEENKGVQEKTDKENQKIKTETSSNCNYDKEEEKLENKLVTTSQSTSSPDINHKGIYWGLGLVSLVLISIVAVVVKKWKLKT